MCARLNHGSIRSGSELLARKPQVSNLASSEHHSNLPLSPPHQCGVVGRNHARHAPKATYITVRRRHDALEIREVSYTWERTCQAILNAGLPAHLLLRLRMEFPSTPSRADDAASRL